MPGSDLTIRAVFEEGGIGIPGTVAEGGGAASAGGSAEEAVTADWEDLLEEWPRIQKSGIEIDACRHLPTFGLLRRRPRQTGGPDSTQVALTEVASTQSRIPVLPSRDRHNRMASVKRTSPARRPSRSQTAACARARSRCSIAASNSGSRRKASDKRHSCESWPSGASTLAADGDCGRGWAGRTDVLGRQLDTRKARRRVSAKDVQDSPQIRREFITRLIAQAGILSQATGEHFFQYHGERGVAVEQGIRLALHDPAGNEVALKRVSVSEELKEDDGGGKQVGAAVAGVREDLFGRHIIRGSKNLARNGKLGNWGGGRCRNRAPWFALQWSETDCSA